MKRVLGLIMLSVATVTVTAYGQQISEEALLERIASICRGYKVYNKWPENVRERALEGGLSPEWMTETLESIVRKNLAVMEKLWAKQDSSWFSGGIPKAYRDAQSAVCDSIIMLRAFPGSNTFDVLKECALSGFLYVVDRAIDSYITIADDGDLIPFFRELTAQGKQGRSALLCPRIEGVITRLKEKNRDADVEKMHAFLLGLVQTEQRWFDVEQLDKLLCSTLDGYAQSVQRKQAVQRFVNAIPENHSGDFQSHIKLQAEVDAVPADKRVDLSKRFKFLEQPKEKGENE